MKGFYKLCGMLTALCLALGIAFSIAGCIAGASPFQMIREGALSFYIDENGIHTGRTQMAETKVAIDNASCEVYDVSQIKNLEVDLDLGTVNFYVHDDSDEIRVEYYNDTGSGTSKLQGDTLHISQNGSERSLTSMDNEIYVDIYVPEGNVFENVTMSVDAGSIYIEEIVAENNFEVDIDAGGLDCGYFQAKNLNVNVDMGYVYFYDGHCTQKAELDCDAGSIELTLNEKVSAFNYDIQSSAGMIEINGNSYSGLDAKQSIDYSADKQIIANVNAGSIYIYMQE